MSDCLNVEKDNTYVRTNKKNHRHSSRRHAALYRSKAKCLYVLCNFYDVCSRSREFLHEWMGFVFLGFITFQYIWFLLRNARRDNADETPTGVKAKLFPRCSGQLKARDTKLV